MNNYTPIIGLEIHVELATKSKMFCGCDANYFGGKPNTHTCPVCLGLPGALPVPNKKAIEWCIRIGLALNCEIPLHSKFDRKNYFYPDLPKGYQISQYDMPLCQKGFLEINGHKIGITRIHLEEDTGSSIHPEGTDYSLVNFNRAGVPLMELVTEPDITSGQEASDFAKELQLIFKYLCVSDADMEKGLMRVEVNISVSKTKEFGTKVEIKNLNSFRVVQKAIDFEIARQIEVLEKGEKVVQETRGWNDKKEITFSQREKESAHDYRYFPEPDLAPLNFEKDELQKIKASLPELPNQKRERFKREYKIEESQIEIFSSQKDLGEYFEKSASELQDWLHAEDVKENKNIYKTLANWLISDVLGFLNGEDFVEATFKCTPENFAEFIKMIYKQEINSKTAKMVLAEMVNTGVDPSTIVDENNWRQVDDDGELQKFIKEVLAKNQKPVDDYKNGNKNALQFLAGQVMKETRGTANPQKVRQLLEKHLGQHVF